MIGAWIRSLWSRLTRKAYRRETTEHIQNRIARSDTTIRESDEELDRLRDELRVLDFKAHKYRHHRHAH